MEVKTGKPFFYRCGFALDEGRSTTTTTTTVGLSQEEDGG